MEYCATTLRKLIDDGIIARMDRNEVWRLARQIIEALVYIHNRNIIHRDLVRSICCTFQPFVGSSDAFIFSPFQRNLEISFLIPRVTFDLETSASRLGEEKTRALPRTKRMFSLRKLVLFMMPLKI